MRVVYFEDTDTALIEFGTAPVHETRGLTDDLYVDLDAAGHVVSITVEHASRRGVPLDFSFERHNGRPAAGSTK